MLCILLVGRSIRIRRLGLVRLERLRSRFSCLVWLFIYIALALGSCGCTLWFAFMLTKQYEEKWLESAFVNTYSRFG